LPTYEKAIVTALTDEEHARLRTQEILKTTTIIERLSAHLAPELVDAEGAGSLPARPR